MLDVMFVGGTKDHVSDCFESDLKYLRRRKSISFFKQMSWLGTLNHSQFKKGELGDYEQ